MGKISAQRVRLSLALALCCLGAAEACALRGMTVQVPAAGGTPRVVTPLAASSTPVLTSTPSVASAPGAAAAVTPAPAVRTPTLGATLPAAASDCPPPPPAPVAVTPVNAPPAGVVTFPPFAVPAHGILIVGDGLYAIEDGEAITVVRGPEVAGLKAPVALSPDGRRLAGTRTGQDLWVADLAEGRAMPLIRGALPGEHAELLDCVWSPDGKWLALLTGGPNHEGGAPWPEYYTLFTVEVSSGRIFEITKHTSSFAWVAQTAELVYKAHCRGGDALFAIQPDGDGARLVCYAEGYFEPFLVSSARDGTLLLAGRGKLLAVDPRDGVARNLLCSREDGDLVPEWPAWSPDGRRVAFEDVVGNVYVVDAVSGQRKVYPGPLRGWLLWSPDSWVLAVQDVSQRISRYGALLLIGVEDAGLVERGRVELPDIPLLMEWR